MAIIRPSQTRAKAIEIYRMCGIQRDKLSPRSSSPAKQDLWNKSDTVQFSQEALDRLEQLKQRQPKDVLRETQTIREEDSQLEKSLKILELASRACGSQRLVAAELRYAPTKRWSRMARVATPPAGGSNRVPSAQLGDR